MTELDARGFPVLLEANNTLLPSKPRTVDTGRDRGTPTPTSGEGSTGSTKASPPTSQAAGAKHDEWSRRHDAVREAAREFETFNTQDVKEWLKGKTNRVLSDAEVASFAVDVRHQQLTDLVDVLDQNERGALRGRRHVKVRAPRGYTAKTLNSLTDDELKHVASRLKAKGWDDKALKGLRGKVPEARQGVFDNLADTDEVLVLDDAIIMPHPQSPPTFEQLAEMMTKMPAPVVNVQPPAVEVKVEPQITVQTPEPRPLVVKRDAKGLLASVEPQ